MEFRILNAYRDGDMKAHRREAKNTALIECVQVAAEKAKWPLREEFKRACRRARAAAASRRVPATPRDPRAAPAPRSAAAHELRPPACRGRASHRGLPPPPPPPPPRGAVAWRDPVLLRVRHQEALR